MFWKFSHREILNWVGGLIGLSLIAMLGFALYALIYEKVPPENKEALTLLIGILSANVGMVVSFYFGSSSTNRKQAETIDTMAKTAAVVTAPPDTVVIPPGESATAQATAAGTIISRDGT